MPTCPHHPDVALIRVKKGWYCEECDRSVLPAEAPLPSLAEALDLDPLPFPVAHPLHFARQADLPPSDRLTNLTFAAYQAMRLTALLLLAEHLAAPTTSRRVASAVAGLRMPHWQEWSQLCDALAKHWRGDFSEERPEASSRFPALVAGWLEVNRSKAPAQDPWAALLVGLPGHGVPQARSLNEAIWRMRNDRGHRMATRTDPAQDEPLLVRFLPVVEALIGHIFPPGALRLVRTAEPNRVLDLHGPHPDLAFPAQPAEPAWAGALGPTGLAAIVAGEPLPVYPLLVPDTDEATEGVQEPALLVDGVKPRHLLLLGVRSHGTSAAHLCAFSAAMERKRVDFGLRRADVKPWTVASWARATAKEELEALRDRKYFRDCYVERAGVDDTVERCLQAPGRGLLLLGEAGAGKSSLMCRLAERLLTADTAPEGSAQERPRGGDVVLFLSGRAAYTGSAGLSADQVLVDALCRRAGIRPGSFRDPRELIEHLADAGSADTELGRRTWILLDALNEADRFADLTQALDRLLPALERHPWLRLVVSLRAGAYRSLERRSLDLGQAGEGVFTHPQHLHAFAGHGEERERPYLLLRPFDEAEAAQAYARRQRSMPERACAVPRERLGLGLRGLLASPLHLHVFHETFRGREAAPMELDEARLFAAYLDALERDLPAIAETLGAIGRYLLDARRPDLPAELADDWVQTWRESLTSQHGSAVMTAHLDPIEQLVSASVLLRPANEGFGTDRRLVAFTFTHQALCEQVLLRELLRCLAPRVRPAPEELLGWAELASGEEGDAPFAELVGALEILAARCVEAGEGGPVAALLDLDDEAVRTAILGAAVRALGPVWGRQEQGSEATRAVLGVLEQTALEESRRGERLNTSAWQARRWLEQSGFSQAARSISFLQLQVRRTLVAAAPQRTDLRRDLSVALNNLGYLALDAGRSTEAYRCFQESLQVLRELVATEPQRTDLRRDLSVALNNLGYLSRAAGRAEEARGFLEEALQVMRALLAADLRRADLRRDLSVTLNHLGNLARSAGQAEEASRYYEESVQVMRELVATEPQRTDLRLDLSVSLNNLGNLAIGAGQSEEARGFLEEALGVIRALLAAEPHRADLRRVLSVSLHYLGELARAAGQSEEARGLFQESLQVMRALVAAEPHRTDLRKELTVSLNNLGGLARAGGQGDEARAFYGESLEVMHALVTAEPHRADLRRNLAICQWNHYLLTGAKEEETGWVRRLFSAFQPRRGAGQGQAQEEAIRWLHAVLDTLRPLREAGDKDAQVTRLWELAVEALRERDESA